LSLISARIVEKYEVLEINHPSPLLRTKTYFLKKEKEKDTTVKMVPS
jgi:uracil DNA glycosylase